MTTNYINDCIDAGLPRPTVSEIVAARDALVAVNPQATVEDIAEFAAARALDAHARALNAAQQDLADDAVGRAKQRDYWRLADALVERWLGNIDPLDPRVGDQPVAFDSLVEAIVDRAHSAAAQVVYRPAR